MQTQKCKFKRFFSNLFLLCLTSIMLIIGGLLGFFILVNFSTFILHDNFIKVLTDSLAIMTPSVENLSPNDVLNLQNLIQKGHILTQDQLMGVLAEFYNNIINTLIVVISLLSFLAYFSIRAFSRKEAEGMIEDAMSKTSPEIEKHVESKFQDKEFISKVFDKVDILQDLTESDKSLGDLNEDMDTLKRKLASLEFWLMRYTDGGNASSIDEKTSENDSKKGK